MWWVPSIVVSLILLVGMTHWFSGADNKDGGLGNVLETLPGVTETPSPGNNLDANISNNSPSNFFGWDRESDLGSAGADNLYYDIEDKRDRAEDLRSNIDSFNYEINRLRRNADLYNADEFSSKLRRLRDEASDLSSEATDIGADDAASALDDTYYDLNRLRRDIESEPRYFYGERDDEIYSNLRKSEWGLDDAGSSIDDFSSGLDDYYGY